MEREGLQVWASEDRPSLMDRPPLERVEVRSNGQKEARTFFVERGTIARQQRMLDKQRQIAEYERNST